MRAGFVGLASSSSTGPGAPGRVRSFTVTTGPPGAANLLWQAPTSNGGSAITSYRVSVSSNGGVTWSSESVVTPPSTSATYASLPAGSNYFFRVRALNAFGSGPFVISGPFTIT